MSRLPKSFLIAKPSKGAVVICCSDPKRHWKGVVTDILLEIPGMVEVTNLQTKARVHVPFSELTRSRC